MATDGHDQQIQLSKPKQMERFLTQPGILKEIAKSLPRHMTADRMVRIALTACVKNPALYECTPQSIYLALLQCSQMGLEVNGRDVHLIPFGNTMTVVCDYKGLVKLAYQSGTVTTFEAHAVRANDVFEYEFGSNQHIKHIPMDGTDEERGPLTHAWAGAKTVNGGYVFVVLQRSAVLRRRAASRSSGSPSSPWNLWEESMWAKSACHQLCKFIPLSPQLEHAVSMPDEGLVIESPKEQVKLAQTKSDALADQLNAMHPQDEREPVPVREQSEQPQQQEMRYSEPMPAEFIARINSAKNEKELRAIGKEVAELLKAGRLTDEQASEINGAATDCRERGFM